MNTHILKFNTLELFENKQFSKGLYQPHTHTHIHAHTHTYTHRTQNSLNSKCQTGDIQIGPHIGHEMETTHTHHHIMPTGIAYIQALEGIIAHLQT